MKIRRRNFIRSASISLTLPWLDIFTKTGRSASNADPLPRRMICICAPLGLHPDNFFPKQSGRDYQLSPYLDILKDYRDEFTVISGLSHAGMGSSFAHQASASFLTGAPGAGRPGFRNSIARVRYRYPGRSEGVQPLRYRQGRLLLLKQSPCTGDMRSGHGSAAHRRISTTGNG